MSRLVGSDSAVAGLLASAVVDSLPKNKAVICSGNISLY